METVPRETYDDLLGSLDELEEKTQKVDRKSKIALGFSTASVIINSAILLLEILL